VCFKLRRYCSCIEVQYTKRNRTKITCSSTKIKREAGPFCIIQFLSLRVTLDLRSPWLLGRCSRQLRAVQVRTCCIQDQNVCEFSYIDWLSMSMGWDYVSELLPPTDILFIPHVIYEKGEQWWNDIKRGKLLILPTEVSDNRASSHLLSNRRNGRTQRWIWFCEIFFFYTAQLTYIP
jgi:hypothetical protein